MLITTFRGERSVAEIADRLFVGLTPRQREKAEKAILKANPQLKNLRKVRAGTILRIPDIPELQHKANRSLDSPDAQLVQTIGDALSGYLDHLSARVKEADADIKSQTAVLKERDFKRAVSSVPELQELTAQVKKTLDARKREIRDRQPTVDRAIDQLLGDLNRDFG
ncbi:MAG: hypothetical protein ABFS23_01455 [Pseudomonadota bacterium]